MYNFQNLKFFPRAFLPRKTPKKGHPNSQKYSDTPHHTEPVALARQSWSNTRVWSVKNERKSQDLSQRIHNKNKNSQEQLLMLIKILGVNSWTGLVNTDDTIGRLMCVPQREWIFSARRKAQLTGTERRRLINLRLIKMCGFGFRRGGGGIRAFIPIRARPR